MTEPTNLQRAKEIVDAAQLVGIPISRDHAQMVAKWGESFRPAVDVVRSIDYQDHEPCNVFNPVDLNPISEESETR